MNLNEAEIISKIDLLLEDNLLNSGFNNDCICKSLGLSRAKLYRVIKKNTSFSLSLYLRHKRLLIAEELLNNSELKISEIGYAVGIDIPQNFSKYFHDKYQLSPRAYRKRAECL
jgi:transcriptional regulator GlxA family with amidase domain